MNSGEVGFVIIGIISLVLGIFLGSWIEASKQDDTVVVPQEHIADPEWQTVEAWGAGYAQGFGDSVAMCREAMHKQREKMLEQMEPLAPGRDSAETPGSGTDRHGATLPRLGSPTLP